MIMENNNFEGGAQMTPDWFGVYGLLRVEPNRFYDVPMQKDWAVEKRKIGEG